jgi:hypothetical protein
MRVIRAELDGGTTLLRNRAGYGCRLATGQQLTSTSCTATVSYRPFVYSIAGAGPLTMMATPSEHDAAPEMARWVVHKKSAAARIGAGFPGGMSSRAG